MTRCYSYPMHRQLVMRLGLLPFLPGVGEHITHAALAVLGGHRRQDQGRVEVGGDAIAGA